MTSGNALVYEAILRVYRNAVVDLIRSGVQAAYPDDYERRVTSAFKTWDDIVSAAARSTVTGVVAHPHQDVFDYLDVSHFPLLLNNYFSVLAPVEGLPSEQANELKRQVVSYAREIKTIRDPLSHPGASDISACQLGCLSSLGQPAEQDPAGGGRVLGRGQCPGGHTQTVGQNRAGRSAFGDGGIEGSGPVADGAGPTSHPRSTRQHTDLGCACFGSVRALDAREPLSEEGAQEFGLLVG